MCNRMSNGRPAGAVLPAGTMVHWYCRCCVDVYDWKLNPMLLCAGLISAWGGVQCQQLLRVWQEWPLEV
jgi:hypothetical protein